MNEIRLIDAKELEIELTKQKVHLMDKAYHTTIESDRMMYINTATGLLHAINILHNTPTVNLKDIYQEGHYDGQLEGYTRAINEERPQGEWVSVSERLPTVYIRCLFCNTDGDIYCGHRNSANDWYDEYLEDLIKNVVAWQPLPEPYQKGGAE